MNLPAAIALGLIVAAVLFVAAVKWHARGLLHAEVELARSQYGAGEHVEGQVRITARKPCHLASVRVSLTCSTTNAQDARRMSRDGWIYQRAQSWTADRTLARGETFARHFSLPMPEPGTLPRSAYLTQAQTRYPPVWSVSARIFCKAATVDAGVVFTPHAETAG